MTVTDWLDRAQARADAAADGPWHENAGNVCDARASRVATLRGSYSEAVPTADFIAAARTDLPAAIAALRAVLDLHQRYEHEAHGAICLACWIGPNVAVYPCSTVRAVATTLGVTP